MTRPQAIQAARELYGDGWTIAAIRRHLAGRGHVVARETVHAWADPDWYERRLETLRPLKRRYDRNRTGTLHFHVLDDDARDRMRQATTNVSPDLMLALRVEDELTYPTIAKVLRRFAGAELSASQVRDRLLALGVEKNPAKARMMRDLNERQRGAAA